MNTIQKPKIQQQKSHIPRILLSLLLFLIIFISLTITTNPINTKAAEVTVDKTEWVAWPGDIYWGGSAEKQGVVFYLYNVEGKYIDFGAKPFTFMASKESNGEKWQAMCNGMGYFQGRKGAIFCDRIVPRPDFPYPATYTEGGSWISTGGDTKAYLEEEIGDSGKQRWEEIVSKYWDNSLIEEIKKDRTNKYRICIESVSAFVPYKNIDNQNYMMKDAFGKPLKLCMANKNIGQLFMHYGVDITTTGSGGTANSTWLQSIATGMVFSDTEDANLIKVPTAPYSGAVSAAEMEDKGYGFGTIKPILTPIHTCNGHTPGDPEEPDPNKGTDGKCTIQKVYWTTYYDKDGNFLRRSPAINKQRSGTTNYIVIDSEPGYTVRKWSTNSGPINPTPENWEGYSGIHNGKGGGEIVLNEEGGEKYLAVWLEKIEVQDKPDEPPYEYIIPQSQIAKRISFQDPDNKDTASAEKMQALRKNIFKVDAPGVTECSGHSCGDLGFNR